MTLAHRAQDIPPSIFAEINTLARQHNAVNLGQGAPEFEAAPEVMAALLAALQSGTVSQYAPSTGAPVLREAIAEHAARFYGQQIDPAREVLVTAGASLGIYFAVMGLVDPGDEVIVFEPIFDTYIPNLTMAEAVPRYIPLRPPEWAFDRDQLTAAFNERTRAILINTPHNPTGKVFTREELSFIAELCQRWDVVAITDEVYEHLLYDGAEHVRLATLPGMAERTLTISSAGKTFSATGFKIGWCVGPEALLEGARRVHQFSLFAVTHPEQAAVAAGLRLPDSYFGSLHDRYQPKRAQMTAMLRAAGLRPALPPDFGAFYLVADFSDVFDGDDLAFARYLISEIGVACIPARAFYYSAANRPQGQKLARFTFCKQDATLQAAAERLARLAR